MKILMISMGKFVCLTMLMIALMAIIVKVISPLLGSCKD